MGQPENRGWGIRDQANSEYMIVSSCHAQRVILSSAFSRLYLSGMPASTTNDYFRQWPTGDYVRFWQQATWTQAVRALNADRSSTPLAASGLSIQDFDPQTFDLLGLRSDLKVKWFDCRNAMLYPQAGAITRYLIPAYLPCDADLQTRFWPGAQTITQPRWPDTSDAIFTLQELNGRAALASTWRATRAAPGVDRRRGV